METNKKQCPVCKGYLFEEDDVVVCPICGAPHHRDCYNTVGHCGLEEFHGTENQYDLLLKKRDAAETKPNEKRKCPHCFREVKESSAFCPYCGFDLNAEEYLQNIRENPLFQNVKVIVADSLGGVDKNTEINGFPIKKVARFTGPNTHYYMPRFAFLKDKKTSWNWAAFLFPYVWAFYRKMYKEGILILLTFIASAVALVPFNNFVESIASALNTNATYTELLKAVIQNIPIINPTTTLLMLAGITINLVCRFILGFKGNIIYKSHCFEQLEKIKNSDGDEDELIRKKGGCNILLMFIMLLVNSYLPQILALIFN